MTTCEHCERLPGYHADLHAGHDWTNVKCPAYRSLRGADCACGEVGTDIHPEPLCPLCSSVLGLLVEQFTGLDSPTALITGWKVVCEENDHTVLTSNEYLDRCRRAEREAEGRGYDPEGEHRSWWWSDECGHDDDQPFPDPAQLLEVLREQGVTACPVGA